HRRLPLHGRRKVLHGPAVRGEHPPGQLHLPPGSPGLPCPTERCEVVATEPYTHSFAELGGPVCRGPRLGGPGLRAPGVGGPGRAMGPLGGLMAHRWVAGGAQPEIATGWPVRADSWAAVTTRTVRRPTSPEGSTVCPVRTAVRKASSSSASVLTP